MSGNSEVQRLAFGKIHHAAFDADILGINPDGQIHIREDILEEKDGPMLRHGLQGMHGAGIVMPRNPVHRPNPDFLHERCARFLAA